jgi:hypothetical protein
MTPIERRDLLRRVVPKSTTFESAPQEWPTQFCVKDLVFYPNARLVGVITKTSTVERSDDATGATSTAAASSRKKPDATPVTVADVTAIVAKFSQEMMAKLKAGEEGAEAKPAATKKKKGKNIFRMGELNCFEAEEPRLMGMFVYRKDRVLYAGKEAMNRNLMQYCGYQMFKFDVRNPTPDRSVVFTFTIYQPTLERILAVLDGNEKAIVSAAVTDISSGQVARAKVRINESDDPLDEEDPLYSEFKLKRGTKEMRLDEYVLLMKSTTTPKPARAARSAPNGAAGNPRRGPD